MINGLLTLLIFQLIGEVLARWLQLPLPGPVVGMLLLFASLLWRGELPEQLRSTAQTVLHYLSLLFVPAGVGVMVHLGLLASQWLPVLISLVVGTLITMTVTALTLRLLSGGSQPPEPPQ